MKHRWLAISTGILVHLAIASAARAERAASGEIVAFELPGFVTMDRSGEQSFFEAAAGVSFFDGEDPDFNARLDLYGQYVTPRGAGGYAALPISFLMAEDDDEGAVGNLELGGLYTLRGSPRAAVTLRGGLMLATADDDPAGSLVNYATAYSRFTDWVSIIPDSTWLRLAASPVYRSGDFFLRVDVGLDLALDEPDDTDLDPVARFNVGAGFTNGSLAIMAELVSVGTTGDVDDENQRFHHTAAISLRAGMGGGAQGFAAIVLPVDEEDTFLAVDFVLIGGLRIPIGR